MRTFHIIKLSLAAAVILLCMPAKAQQLVGGKVSLLNKEEIGRASCRERV